LPGGALWQGLGGALAGVLVGVLAGALVLLGVNGVQALRRRIPSGR
jgi:ABC-type Co2+ transport system permease subunit